MSLAARLLAALALPLLAQAPVLHGADSVFAGPDVGIVWGVLRGEAEDKTLVVIRVTNPSRRYAWIKVEGVDPFTQRRLDVVAGMALGGHADVRSQPSCRRRRGESGDEQGRYQPDAHERPPVVIA